MALLELRDVSKYYGHQQVLHSVNLTIEEGTVTSLIGASGSGKSTLLRCITLLETINSGSITFSGHEITGPEVDINRVRRRIGIVFQSFNLFPHMTVLQNVMLGPVHALGERKEVASDRAHELLSRVGLAEKATAYPDRLSGGQQQRAAIARALAMSPQVILLDEVTSALDPELVGEVLSLIRELAEGGMTLILATHEMQFAREISSTVCFLDGGVVLEQGSPDELFGRPKNERTKAFLRRVLQ